MPHWNIQNQVVELGYSKGQLRDLMLFTTLIWKDHIFQTPLTIIYMCLKSGLYIKAVIFWISEHSQISAA